MKTFRTFCWRAWVPTVLLICSSVSVLQAQTGFTEKDRQTLTALQFRVEETTKAIETLRQDTNKRFEELREDMNKRFESVDRRFEEHRETMDRRFESVDKRFEQLIHFLYILAGIFTTLVVAVIAFAYWDRRTIIHEARRQTIDHLEREGIVRRIVLALQEYSQKDGDLRQILKSFNLL
ncbi:MAG: hypothetical protein WHS46_11250 [Desulfosoma sp.]